VAEASAMLASHGGELIVTKEKTSTVTLAVARSNRA
jgi:cobalt-precorrin 5A hydrolase